VTVVKKIFGLNGRKRLKCVAQNSPTRIKNSDVHDIAIGHKKITLETIKIVEYYERFFDFMGLDVTLICKTMPVSPVQWFDESMTAISNSTK
jgi:hypothetical protein